MRSVVDRKVDVETDCRIEGLEEKAFINSSPLGR